MSLVDNVSEITRTSWDEVWQMGVVLFYNLAAYGKEKRRREKEEMDKMMAKNSK